MLFCFHNCHWFILMTNGFLVIPAILKLTYKNFFFFFKTSSLSASLLVVAHNKIQPSCLLSSPSFFSFFLPPFFSPLCFNCCFLRADSSHWKNLTLSGTLRDRFEIWLEWPKLQPGSGWQGRTVGRCGRQAGIPPAEEKSGGGDECFMLRSSSPAPLSLPAPATSVRLDFNTAVLHQGHPQLQTLNRESYESRMNSASLHEELLYIVQKAATRVLDHSGGFLQRV